MGWWPVTGLFLWRVLSCDGFCPVVGFVVSRVLSCHGFFDFMIVFVFQCFHTTFRRLLYYCSFPIILEHIMNLTQSHEYLWYVDNFDNMHVLYTKTNGLTTKQAAKSRTSDGRGRQTVAGCGLSRIWRSIGGGEVNAKGGVSYTDVGWGQQNQHSMGSSVWV